MAINSPLLEDVSIEGAQGILVNITGGPDLGMMEVSDAVAMIEGAAHENAHIILGHVNVDEPCEEVKITVIATGFAQEESPRDTLRRSSRRSRPQSNSQTGGYYGLNGASSPVPSGAGRTSEAHDSVPVPVPTGGRMSNTGRVTVSPENDLDTPTYLRKK
jgi:cell division protein FtsZ